MQKPEPEVLSSVYNATRILREFSPEKRVLGISEISRRLGIAKSTAFRLIKTLNEANLVEKDEETNKYRLGLAVLEMGFSVYYSTELSTIAHSVLKMAAESTRKVARLGVYDQGEVVYLSKRSNHHDLGTVSKTGNRVPTYCTAVGKVLLAYQSEEEIESVLNMRLKRFTSQTITQPELLIDQLKDIREQGYATTNAELRNGISSIAVPVFDDFGKVVAAISLTGTGDRFPSAEAYAKELELYSNLITEKLGV